MIKLIPILTALTLTGCAITPKPITGPDGSPHYLIESYSIEFAYEKARETCKGPYKIINSTQQTSSGANSDVSTVYELLIKCDNPPEATTSPDATTSPEANISLGK